MYGVRIVNETMKDILNLDQEWKTEWERLRRSNCPIVLFGAGSTSIFILNVFRENNIEPVCFCDNNPEKQNKCIDTLRVLSLCDVVAEYSNCIFYITTQLYYREIQKQLKEIGISDDRIIQYDLICQFEWEKNYLYFIKNHEDEIEKFMNELEDEKSKQTVKDRLAFLVTRRRCFAGNSRSEIQYFEDSIIDYRKIKAFIDIGTYTGDSILEFEKHNDMSQCVVYGFEMDEELYKCAKMNLKHLGDRVILLQKAVSDKNGIECLTGKLGEMQSIVSGTFSEQEKKEVVFETCKLDSVLDKNISNAFIKMDIEGAELSAIKGAEEFIKKNHPILAICIYHKAEDIIEIPQTIKKYHSDYRFYVRHYSDNQTETVLYAIPK